MKTTNRQERVCEIAGEYLNDEASGIEEIDNLNPPPAWLGAGIVGMAFVAGTVTGVCAGSLLRQVWRWMTVSALALAMMASARAQSNSICRQFTPGPLPGSTAHAHAPQPASPAILTQKAQIAGEIFARRLDALGMIESGNNDYAVGKDGEISRYQISRSVWKAQKVKLAAATNPLMASIVVESIMMGRQIQFCRGFHRQPTDFEWYLLWNRPSCFFGNYQPSGVDLDRAWRFKNLCGQFRN